VQASASSLMRNGAGEALSWARKKSMQFLKGKENIFSAPWLAPRPQ
jgi:hypothetical protein